MVRASTGGLEISFQELKVKGGNFGDQEISLEESTKNSLDLVMLETQKQLYDTLIYENKNSWF